MVKSQKTAYPASVWLALLAVYLVWGSTYLAIRFAIESIPPFLMAGTRFLTSGLILYGFMRFQGIAPPRSIHWRSALIIGFFLLVVGNGGVSWAEKWVPSGIAALLVGTVPLWMALLEWKRGIQSGLKVWLGIFLGMAGIALLVFPHSQGAVTWDPWAALLLVGTSLGWSYGSLYARTAPLPASALMATSLEMMAGGACQLLVGLLLGEASQFHWADLTSHSVNAWVYLTLVGSLVGFTAYIWVLQKATPGLASTYAFVNPVIAVFLGWLMAGEALTPTVFGAAGLIVGAVVLITIGRPKTNKIRR